MKKIIFTIIIALIFSSNICSQNDYIILKSNERITIKDSALSDGAGKVTYYLPNRKGNKAKSIKLELVKEISSGGFEYIASPKEGTVNKRRRRPYKVLISSNDKKLIYRTTMDEYSYWHYTVRIIDNDKEYLFGASYKETSIKEKNVKARKDIISEIKKHFSNCDNIISLLKEYLNENLESKDPYGSIKTGITGFLNHTKPTICN